MAEILLKRLEVGDLERGREDVDDGRGMGCALVVVMLLGLLPAARDAAAAAALSGVMIDMWPSGLCKYISASSLVLVVVIVETGEEASTIRG